MNMSAPTSSLEDNSKTLHIVHIVFQRVRGQQTFWECFEIHTTKEAEYEWLTTHKSANGAKNMPFVT